MPFCKLFSKNTAFIVFSFISICPLFFNFWSQPTVDLTIKAFVFIYLMPYTVC